MKHFLTDLQPHFLEYEFNKLSKVLLELEIHKHLLSDFRWIYIFLAHYDFNKCFFGQFETVCISLLKNMKNGHPFLWVSQG